MYSIAPLIAPWLLPEDREAMLIAHRCFESVLFDMKSHIWSLHSWPRSVSLESQETWSNIFTVLKQKMPGVKDLEIHVYDRVLSPAAVECLLRVLHDSHLAECIIVLHAGDEILAPFTTVMSYIAELPCSVEFILKFTELSVNGLLAYALRKFIAALDCCRELNFDKKDKKDKKDLTLDCRIDYGVGNVCAQANMHMSDVAAAVPGGLIKSIRCTQQPGSHYAVRLSDATFASLSQAPRFGVTLRSYLSLSDPPKQVIECAKIIVDETVTDCTVHTLNKIEFISQRCKQLISYHLTLVSSEFAFVNDGYNLTECMKELNGSCIKYLRLCGDALLAPSVITLLRHMIRLRTRAELSIGIDVAPKDKSIYAICGELVMRYVHGTMVEVDYDHPDAYKYSRMTHPALLNELLTLSMSVHDAWAMLRPPA